MPGSAAAGSRAGVRSCTGRACPVPPWGSWAWASSARRSPAAWPDSRQRSTYHDARPLDPGTEQALAASYRSLEQATRASDVLIVALPLNNRTRHLIDAELIGLMR